MTKSVREMKGVGEKTEKLLEKLGIATTWDLVTYYPARYEAYEGPVPIAGLKEGELRSVCAFPLSLPSRVKAASGAVTLVAKLKDSSGTIEATWFGSAYLQHVLHPGSKAYFRGKVVRLGNHLSLSHPQVYTEEDYERLSGSLQPVYPLTKGVNNKLLVRLIRQALEEEGAVREYLPSSVLERFSFLPEAEARMRLHFPRSEEERDAARHRLVFDEFFLFILAVQRLKMRVGEAKNTFPMKKDWEGEKTIENLPFALTGAQMRTWREVEENLCGRKLMNRLIQGDVGSGKTVVAFLAILKAVRAGYQAALMAPTAVLASQHMDSFVDFLEKQGIEGVHPVLLTGSRTAAQKRKAREGIADGTYQVIIGTSALIQEQVSYHNLGLAVIDEQHRFGVHQREILSRRGKAPHVLVMSATPIPRTLALILYGDLDISVMDELPGGRLPIKNASVGPAWRPNAYRFLSKEVEAGRQAYVICPMVEASEGLECENVTDYAVLLRKELPKYHIGVLHGQMKAKEKDAVMESFSKGEIQILVSTTVVEVGVNVPNASVMMIENAERFGLAQLHQLRGRVGRGNEQSYCIFVQGSEEEEAAKRLDFIAKTNDGFQVAAEDLRLRGQGDFFGTRQSGDFLFVLGDIYQDADILKEASEIAGAIMEVDPGLTLPEHAALKERFTLSYPEEGLVTM